MLPARQAVHQFLPDEVNEEAREDTPKTMFITRI
jgi:hypothetical protein